MTLLPTSLLVSAMALVLATESHAQRRAILDPASHSSVSGEWALHVAPTQRDGSGPGRYRMVRDGDLAWEGELPFTFWDAAVGDDGTAIGYAYSSGLWGERENVCGELVIAIVAPDGKTRQRWSHSRFTSKVGGPPAPRVTDVFVQPLWHRAFLDVGGSGATSEAWWVYDLDVATRADSVDPVRASEAGKGSVLFAARALEGAPLLLAHFGLFGRDRTGALFVLLNQDLEPVWSEEALVGEAARPGPRQIPAGVEAASSGAGIPPIGSGQFATLRFVDAERVTYQVTSDPSVETRWRVTEIARGEIEPTVSTEPRVVPIELRIAGDFRRKPSAVQRDLERSRRGWAWDGDDLVRPGKRGKTKQRLSLRPDGTWIQGGSWARGEGIVGDADGAIVAYDGRVSTFEADGTGRATYDVPDGAYWSFAYASGWIALASGSDSVLLVRESDGGLFCLVHEHELGDPNDALLVSKDGKELWLFDGKPCVVTRYELPPR